jgi:type I restriction enzyme S subunit
MSNLPRQTSRKSGHFGDLVDLVRDKYVPTQAAADVPCINLENISEGSGRVTGWSKSSDNLSTKTSFQAGDILFSKLRPYLRKYAQPRFRGVCTSELLAFRAKSGVDPRYVYQVVGSPAFIEHCVASSFGTKMPRTDWKSASSFAVQIPVEAEQRRIADLLSAVDELLAIGESRVEKLVKQRDGFIQRELLRAASNAAEVALGAIAPLVTSGSRGWASFYADEGALFLRIGNLTRKHPNLRLDDIVRVKVPPGGEGARTKLQEGDVLISITADLGIVGCVPTGLGEAYINQHIALARVTDTSMYSRWVAHVLASTYGRQQVARLNDGGAKAGLNLPTIRRLKVPKAPLEQQHRIASALDAMDDQIAYEHAGIEKLAMQKQGLLQSLLGTFARAQKGAAS